MKIRSAAPSDLDSIVEVFRACWNISYQDLLPSTVREDMTIEAAKNMWSGAVQPHPDRSTLIAEIEGKVVGIARFGIDPENDNSGHLFSLYIHPRYSGQGIGRALLQETIKQVREKGFTSQSLWVFKDNENAKKLYLSESFTPSGEIRTDPRWQIPEMKMVLNLEL